MRQNCNEKMRPIRKCDQQNATNATNYNIATTLLFNAIDREIKELLPYNIFIITRHYKRVKIRVVVEKLLPNKKQ